MTTMTAQAVEALPETSQLSGTAPVGGTGIDLERDIHREWLITNGRGGYASGTVIGIPTRRYHGLLIAAARPPLERWLMLAATLESAGVSGRHHEMASFEFDRTIHPRGYQYLTGFAVHNRRPEPWVRFTYEHDGLRFVKQVAMQRNSDELSIRYRLEGPGEEPLTLEIVPFLALRDFHATTRAFDGAYPIHEQDDQVAVDAYARGPRLWLQAIRIDDGQVMRFEQKPVWWNGVVHRAETERGLEDHDDLFVPGWFSTAGSKVIQVEFRAKADFTEDMNGALEPRPARAIDYSAEGVHSAEGRLREAADAFIVKRRRPSGTELTTILSGYPWFGDWGRDTFISLPGLLLDTGRFAEARQVLEVFASAMTDGLIPNRFSDYGDGRDYNSVDASLWFIHAADAYVRSSGDEQTWHTILAPACDAIVNAYLAGTRYSIRVGEDGLIACGDESTSLTWMDARCGDAVFTPRHGQPVEVNALWYHVLCTLADRCLPSNPARADQLEAAAARARDSFRLVFWNYSGGYLYDVVRDGWSDPAVRPNQVFAVSLPHSPLDDEQKRSVLNIVQNRLLTPYGLRSLCTKHPAYGGRYEGDAFHRDQVYHQGTVWAWLMGPYVEACLRLHAFSEAARSSMRQLLQPLIAHLDEAGTGSISEIFDGDPPHRPRGCIAQAWSVAEVYRAWRMTAPNAR
jgi:predicted glycogen debranching enzyme